MLQGAEAVAPVYNALQALRARCHELVPGSRDPNVTRLLKDLGDQHAQQASEVAVLLSDLWAATGIRAPADAAMGAAPVAPPAFPGPAVHCDTDILAGLWRAEDSLLAAYDEAMRWQQNGSALLSLLTRHQVAILTSVQRIEAALDLSGAGAGPGV